MTPNRLITLAIHTYEKALPVKNLLEREGVYVELNNVNLSLPEVSSGVRIRIREADLPLALRIVENFDIFAVPDTVRQRGKVLVPTDFTDNSLNAVSQAADISARLQCDMEFIYAFMSPMKREIVQLSDSYDYELADMEATRMLGEEATELMKQFTSKVKSGMKDGSLPVVKFSASVAEGLPEEVIVEHTREHKPPLLVMGTRAARKKEMDLIGSVTAEVMDSCRVPVLTIPENVNTASLSVKRVAFFCNLDQEDMLAVDALYRFYRGLELEVTFIPVPQRSRLLALSSSRQSGEKLLTYCREHYPDISFSLSGEDLQAVAARMSKCEGMTEFDLICIPIKRKSAIARVFNPSLAHRILFRADMPMLVIPV